MRELAQNLRLSPSEIPHRIYGLENWGAGYFGVSEQGCLTVHPTRNPAGSPALSLDRLRVQYGQGFFKGVMISPVDRNRFLDELAQKAGLKREGDRLVRA